MLTYYKKRYYKDKFLSLEQYDQQLKNIIKNKNNIENGFKYLTLILESQEDFLNLVNLNLIYNILGDLILCIRAMNFYYYFKSNPSNKKNGSALQYLNNIEFLKNQIYETKYNTNFLKKRRLINSVLTELIKIKYDYNKYLYKNAIEYTLNFINYD